MPQHLHGKDAINSTERMALLESGVALFNTGSWFACHDVFERLWRAEGTPCRDVFKALVQVAAGMYHAEHGNINGAMRLFGRAGELISKQLADRIAEPWAEYEVLLCSEIGIDIVPLWFWLQQLVQHRKEDSSVVPYSFLSGNDVPPLTMCGSGVTGWE